MGLTTGRAEELEIRSIITEIEIMDNAEGTSGLTDSDREKRTLLKLNLANKLNMEAISWKQKSREKWLKDSDRNTKYFYC